VAGVEVGGVHVSDDGGRTWETRSDGVHDDVHELHVVGDGEYVAATGDGLYRTADGGWTWARLDGAAEQSYFRRAASLDGVVYASGALANSSTWDDADAEPVLLAARGDGRAEPVPGPGDGETVTGLTAVGSRLVAATHRGSVFARGDGGWRPVGEFPTEGPLTGRHTPVTSLGT
jgi:photosystem II stability/assembly factor-like uncharacterized protein